MNKQQLIQEIKDMRNKLASMEKELNKHEEHIQFPRTGDNYFFYLPNGSIEDCYATNDRIKPNAYKIKEEAKEAYNKAVAVEKVNRRILELQGEWEPDWYDTKEPKLYIIYDNGRNKFSISGWYTSKLCYPIKEIKSRNIAEQIITEMNIELKIIFDLQE